MTNRILVGLPALPDYMDDKLWEKDISVKFCFSVDFPLIPCFLIWPQSTLLVNMTQVWPHKLSSIRDREEPMLPRQSKRRKGSSMLAGVDILNVFRCIENWSNHIVEFTIYSSIQDDTSKT